MTYSIEGSILIPSDTAITAVNFGDVITVAGSAGLPEYDVDWLGTNRFIMHYAQWASGDHVSQTDNLALLEFDATTNLMSLVSTLSTTSLFTNVNGPTVVDGRKARITALGAGHALLVYPKTSGGYANMFAARVVNINGDSLSLASTENLLFGTQFGTEGYFPFDPTDYAGFLAQSYDPLSIKSWDDQNVGIFMRYKPYIAVQSNRYWISHLHVEGEVVTASAPLEAFPDLRTAGGPGAFVTTRIHWNLVPGSSAFGAAVDYESDRDYGGSKNYSNTQFRLVYLPNPSLGTLNIIEGDDSTPSREIMATMFGTDHIVIYPEVSS